jgi:hypothetical protein
MIESFATYNSVYEIDWGNSRIRRNSGTNDPTPRQGNDGVWKSFASISQVILGENVLIVWRYVGTGDDEVAESTITSAVLSLGEWVHDGQG